jgi:hypothetical protein
MYQKDSVKDSQINGGSLSAHDLEGSPRQVICISFLLLNVFEDQIVTVDMRLQNEVTPAKQSVTSWAKKTTNGPFVIPGSTQNPLVSKGITLLDSPIELPGRLIRPNMPTDLERTSE